MNLYVQGDLLLIPRKAVSSKGKAVIAPDPDGSTVLARGETTGHRHRFAPGSDVLMFRDDAMARAVPDNLYIGNIKLGADTALLHEDHATQIIPKGDYEVRGQRRETVSFDPETNVRDSIITRAID